MTYVLFEHEELRANLLPFTFTRHVSEIRCGILTIKEKWEKHLGQEVLLQYGEPLDRFFNKALPKGDKIYINAALLPDAEIISIIQELESANGIQNKETLLAYRSVENLDSENLSTPRLFEMSDYYGHTNLIYNKWHIFKLNRQEIEADFKLICSGRQSAKINDPNTIVYGEENIFIEEGAQIRSAILNAEKGPIYIGKNAVIEEGAIIRGALALCENATINTGAKLRGDSTIGPFSKVGGEVSNSVIFAYSNKGHDGFLGNSVLGEWCNIGADSNTSNLKNNYAEVKLWNYGLRKFERTGETFCGLMMGDHSKCGINTMFNTGTVIGVGSNIFGSGFPANFLPSFFWGGPQSKATFTINKMLETARIVMKRRNLEMTKTQEEILRLTFVHTQSNRPWDN